MNYFYRTSIFIERRTFSFRQLKPLIYQIKARKLTEVSYHRNIDVQTNQYLLQTKKSLISQCSFLHNSDRLLEDDDHMDNIDDIKDLHHDEMSQYQSVKHILYPDSEDPYINKLNECESIQEVLNFIKENESKLQHEHISQAVLMLWDLQKMFLYGLQMNGISNDALIKDHLSQLINHSEFSKLLDLIKSKYMKFNIEATSCVLLYLNKMGLELRHDVLQLLVLKLVKHLNNITLSALSRFIVTMSSEPSLAMYFTFQRCMPFITECLGKCDSAEDLKLITICLHNLQHLVTADLLQQYQNKVVELMEKNELTSAVSRSVLKVIMFLSHSGSDSNAVLISKLMILLKNNLHTLTISDFLIAYEILYRNHEPGELLTEMQRCGSRLLLLLDDENNSSNEARLKLLPCTVCFSSPKHRPEYEKILLNYVKGPLTLSSIYNLLRIITFVKPNKKLCDEVWDNILITIKSKQLDPDNLLKLSQKYMNFCNDVNYRYESFEKHILNLLKAELKDGITGLIPSKKAIAYAFIICYETDMDVLDEIVTNITENWEQLNHADCLYISKGLGNGDTQKKYLNSNKRLRQINDAMDKLINEKLILQGDGTKVNFLLKSCIYRKNRSGKLIEKLLLNLDPNEISSSNAIRNVIFSLQATNGLLPDIINSISKYAIDYKDNLLGFNGEKIAYLCYQLGFLPNRSDELFQIITDLILRDQERISGLSYIQVALALCFFYKLPESFIKNIFNVNFLEKLDSELATCYFKDVYPIRVRNSMMQLNRAVCLDYPQANVPWFHQKYIEQLQAQDEKGRHTLELNNKFKYYLLKVIDDPECITENSYSPYGYHIHFLLHLDQNGQLLKSNMNDEIANRLAVLLLKSNSYTTINVQLKGKYQLKKRHLEILGYKVLPVNIDEWSSLIHDDERVEYINKLIWPKNSSISSQLYSYVVR